MCVEERLNSIIRQAIVRVSFCRVLCGRKHYKTSKSNPRGLLFQRQPLYVLLNERADISASSWREPVLYSSTNKYLHVASMCKYSKRLLLQVHNNKQSSREKYMFSKLAYIIKHELQSLWYYQYPLCYNLTVACAEMSLECVAGFKALRTVRTVVRRLPGVTS